MKSNEIAPINFVNQNNTADDLRLRERHQGRSASFTSKFGPIDELPEENDAYLKENGNNEVVINTCVDDESDDNDDENDDNLVQKCQKQCLAKCSQYKKYILIALGFVCLVGYTVYLVFAIRYDFNLAKALIYITAIVAVFVIYALIRDSCGPTIWRKCLYPLSKFWNKNWHIIKWFLYPLLVILFLLYLLLFILKEMKQLQSLSGLVIFILISYITSKHPNKISWRPVIWGFALQFLMGVFVLRWQFGYSFVKFLGDEITKFINYAYDGAAVVYGDPFMVFHPFAFMGLSMIIYMGAVMSMLYYAGITQLLAGKMAWLMQKTMGTTAIETFGVASNIFLNGMDTMLMLRPYLDLLTKSEFFCFLVGGHSTIAGFAFGLFVLFGAPPQHLISGAVMSAPAVIAICKLNYPETKQSITKNVEDVQLTRGTETNIFEACANGASIAGKTVAAVLVNYIAFLGLLAWVNATLSWIGERVGYAELSFEVICSYLFWPIALIIGIDVNDCKGVAKLIGIKVFTTEILAYQELGKDFRNGLISDRSRTIGTYALCGFSSISTLAIAVGVWSSICPQRVPRMASMMFRALVNANMSCFMTACIAGLMYRGELSDDDGGSPLLTALMGLIPSYKDLMALVGM